MPKKDIKPLDVKNESNDGPQSVELTHNETELNPIVMDNVSSSKEIAPLAETIIEPDTSVIDKTFSQRETLEIVVEEVVQVSLDKIIDKNQNDDGSNYSMSVIASSKNNENYNICDKDIEEDDEEEKLYDRQEENEDEGEENEEEGEENEDEGEEAVELWDLKVIFPAKDIKKSNPIRCSTADCLLVACSVWTSNQNPETPWYTCLDCQETDFGGWPDSKEELPLTVLTEDHAKAMLEKCTNDRENLKLPNLPSSKRIDSKQGGRQEDNNKDGIKSNLIENDAEEEWDLKEIFDVEDLTKSEPVMCADNDCNLVACCVWVSNKHPDKPWFTCLDCQKRDFGGFPEEEDLPEKELTEENRKLILKICTKNCENSELPNLPTSASVALTGKDKNMRSYAAITPPPGYEKSLTQSQSNIVVGALQARSMSINEKVSVTPSPIPPNGVSKKITTLISKDDIPRAPSKEALAIHRKWQAEAERHGGPDARIVVSKPAAKKMIFEVLHDNFTPMNITEVYNRLKAAVPSPILKSCLDDMSDNFHGNNPFDDNSDEGEKCSKRAKKDLGASDQYTGSLRLKEGRNVNCNLYYVDQSKLENNGNGLDIEKKNELYENLEKTNREIEILSQTLRENTLRIARLLSEPTNEEIEIQLQEQEKQLESLKNSLDEALTFAGNEKYNKQLSDRVSKMSSFWRKRKRQCMEFLMLMEDSTEGSISVKKCLSGDGQICIDSDESVITNTAAFAKKKKVCANVCNWKGRNTLCDRESAGLNPDPSFVGVRVDTNGNIERVYLRDE